MEAFQEFDHPEHKAHFLYMLSKVLLDLGEKETAYKTFLETEMLFRRTRYGRASADVSKTLFLNEWGRLHPVPSFTPTVQVEPTNYCNLDCIMCGRNKRRPLGHMSFPIFKKIVDESLAAGACGIRLFHMGEPLLNTCLTEFIRYFNSRAKELDLGEDCMRRAIGIMTNGTLLNRDLAGQLMGSGLDQIGFSIDGRSPEEYEKVRRNASFSRVLENLRAAREVRDDRRFPTEISVSVLDMELEPRDKSRLNDFYLLNGADSVSFIPCARQEGRHVVNKEGDIVPARSTSYPENAGSGHPESGGQAPAQGLLDRIVVLWNGDIKSFTGEPSGEDILGNIENLSLVEAYDLKMKALGLA